MKTFFFALILCTVATFCDTNEFIVPKKTVVSLASLKQDCCQEAAYVLKECAELQQRMGKAHVGLIDAMADLLDGSGSGAFAKPTKTKLEKFHHELKKTQAQVQQLSAQFDDLYSVVKK